MAIPQILLAATKLPFIGPVLKHFMPNLRLFLEYALVAAVITIGGVTVHLWHVKKALIAQTDKLKAEVTSLQLINEMQEQSIDLLKNARDKDAEAIIALDKERARLDKLYDTNKKRIAQLERENEAVRDYLAGRIPPDLACLLNRTCRTDGSEGGSPPSERRAATGVRAGQR